MIRLRNPHINRGFMNLRLNTKADQIWFLNALVLSVITISALVWQAFTSSLVSIREGCGNDGGHYCAMAGTSPVPNFPNTPYSQRVLLPFLVRFVFSPTKIIETISAFALLNSIFIAGSCILIYLIILKLNNKTNFLLPLIASLLFLLHPFTYRLTLSYPVLTDQLTYFLIFTIAYLLLFNQKYLNVLIVFLAFLLILTRLHYGILVMLVLIVIIKHLRTNKAFLITSIVTLTSLGLYISLTRKYYGSSNPDFIEMFSKDVLLSFTNLAFLGRQLLLIFVGLGFYSIWIISSLKTIKKNYIHQFLILFAVLNGLISFTFGAGGDTDRYLTISGFLILIIVFSNLSKMTNSQILWFIPTIYATILIWEPFMYKFEDELRFEFMFARRWTEPSVVLERSSEVILLSLILLFISFYLKIKSKKLEI